MLCQKPIFGLGSAMSLFVLPFPAIDPILFQWGPLQIHWYGIAYAAGFLLGWSYAISLVTNQILWGDGPCPVTKKNVGDGVTWAIIGVLAGGRLGYVFFYGLDTYLQNPYQIFFIWEGGMSFHGGLLGSLLAMILFAHRQKLSMLTALDIIAAVAPFGLFFGRLANFINGELYGKPTSVPWSFVFPTADAQPRHPSQLYEAFLEGIVLFCILRLLTHTFSKFRQPGVVGATFLIAYGTFRFMVEFFRLPDAHIGYLSSGWLTMGMLLSVPMIAVGIIVLCFLKIRLKIRRNFTLNS